NDIAVIRAREAGERRPLRLGPLYQLHPGRSRSLVRHHDRLHGNCLLGHLSLWWKCCRDGKPVRHLILTRLDASAAQSMSASLRKRLKSRSAVNDVTCQKRTLRRPHSITSSARSRAEVDNSIPIALAVLRLIVNFAFMDFISL